MISRCFYAFIYFLAMISCYVIALVVSVCVCVCVYVDCF